MKNNNFKCPFCGGDMIWSSDANANDLCSDYADDDEAVIHYFLCSKCGRDYEIIDPPKEQRENDYKDYWIGIS